MAADAALDEARQLVKQGLLGEASAALARIAPDAPASERAGAELLAGNIAYERGQYAQAHEAWARAEQLYAGQEAQGDGAQVARGNIALADDRLAHQQALDTRVQQLQAGVGLVLVLALAAFGFAATRPSTTGRPAGPPPPA